MVDRGRGTDPLPPVMWGRTPFPRAGVHRVGLEGWDGAKSSKIGPTMVELPIVQR